MRNIDAECYTIKRCTEVIERVRPANYVDITSGNVSPDHVHMLILAPSNLSVLKGGAI